ncbi:MAG: hypothetical protein QOJ11_3874 [Frankiales bacterium]|jgi:uncharacterized protein YceK|nr:hypothetical protein [Frankiales bacterium]
MTIVALSCPRCSVRSEAAVDAVLVAASSGLSDEEGRPTVCWICSGCSTLVHHGIDWQAFALLVSAGAALIDEDDHDLRPAHPESAATGPMWTYDDLLDLHVLLFTCDWFAELEEAADTPADQG